MEEGGFKTERKPVMVNLTLEQVQLIHANGQLHSNGDFEYMNLPQWFFRKSGDTSMVFQMIDEWQLPDWIKKYNFDSIPPQEFLSFLGKWCTYKNITCMITGIPQLFIKNFKLTPMKSSDDIGLGFGRTAELSITEFDREVSLC